MFFKLKNQERLIKKAILKAGSYRKLKSIVKIPRSTILEYSKGRPISKGRLVKLFNFLEINDVDKQILERLPNNWKQIKGGKNCVASKKEKGTFEKEMKKWQDFQSKKLKIWHESMKKYHPVEYYQKQYSRFKKIAGYKYKTLKGERVRNIFEKQIADILFEKGINYKYEPLVNAGNRYFFPDFLIKNNILIECTMWKGEENAYKLKEKIECLKDKYKILVVIPKTLNRYYKIINNHLILGLDEFVLVAQTF